MIENLTDEQIRDWRDSPVSEAMERAMRLQIAARKAALTQAYWHGEPRPEAERLVVQMIEEWTNDFFEASADDLRVFIESSEDEQPFRHSADGIHGAGGT